MPRPSSVIDQLPEQDQEKVISWLELHSTREVIEMVAKAPPEGFGLKTHATTLRRFYARHQSLSHAFDLESAQSCKSNSATSTFREAAETLLNHWAFSVASNPRKSTVAFKALTSWSYRAHEIRQRDALIQISKDRLSLDWQKFQFNAARAALKCHDDLGRILDDPHTDEEAKINAARKHLFHDPDSFDSPTAESSYDGSSGKNQ